MNFLQLQSNKSYKKWSRVITYERARTRVKQLYLYVCKLFEWNTRRVIIAKYKKPVLCGNCVVSYNSVTCLLSRTQSLCTRWLPLLYREQWWVVQCCADVYVWLVVDQVRSMTGYVILIVAGSIEYSFLWQHNVQSYPHPPLRSAKMR